MRPSRKVAIIGGKRIPFVKPFTTYKRNVLIAVVSSLTDAYKLEGKVIGDGKRSISPF